MFKAIDGTKVKRLALILAAAFALTTPALGVDADALRQSQPERGLVHIDKLLAKIKAEHPEARILKVELRPADEGSGRDWLYEVKVFPPDGRILKLVYDARTLVLLERFGGDGGPGQRRLRLRRGWQGGMDKSSSSEAAGRKQ